MSPALPHHYTSWHKEHVLFVIIYAATLNSHKLFVLVNFVVCLMTKTKGSRAKIPILTAGIRIDA